MKKSYRVLLIEHGYPKSMVDSWDDKYCENEWKELRSFIKENNLQ